MSKAVKVLRVKLEVGFVEVRDERKKKVSRRTEVEMSKMRGLAGRSLGDLLSLFQAFAMAKLGSGSSFREYCD